MKKRPIAITMALFLVAISTRALGETVDLSDLSSTALTIKAWEALSKGEFKNVDIYTDKCVGLYKDDALRQQRMLKDFPDAGEVEKYEALNNVGVSLFIRGEALFQQKRYDEAKVYYQDMIDNYGFSQYWDPKGWYWKVAEKSQAVLDKIDRLSKQETRILKEKEISLIEGLHFPLFDEGKEEIVDYKRYGKFKNIGTPDYKYVILDRKGLADAAGEGIFPNNSIFKDPLYKGYLKDGTLEGSHWDFVSSDNLQANFYKWATTGEDPGVKLFYTAHALERAMHYRHAVKAYYAIIVHYPKTISWTYWKTPWYVGQVAIDKIKYLTRRHPELDMKLLDAGIIVENGFDYDVKNDIISVNPGMIVKCEPEELKAKALDLTGLKVIKTIGGPKTELIQYENGHWQLMVGGGPFIVKAVCYTPTVVGQSPDKGTLRDWTFEDYDQNGKIDGPYDSWIDNSLNNKKDAGENVVGDFQLLKNMGANAIRVYHHGNNQNKKIFRMLYEDYGIMVIMGDFLGAYATGSGATWHEGTNYSNPVHQENMKSSVRKMIKEYKDEPYILMWVLGNETNYGVANNAKKDPASFYRFVNDVAKMIKGLDPTRPVAICNGDTFFLDIFSKYAPDVDIYGSNSYRGEQGFGIGMWESVKRLCDKPVLITEYGCPAYQRGKTREVAEVEQAGYHQGAWEDILYNSAGYGVGNSIGGVAFEWMDEWWKAYEPDIHDTEALYTGPFPGGWVYEEWFGLVSQGDGSKSPFLRQLRKSYFMYKKMWSEAQTYGTE